MEENPGHYSYLSEDPVKASETRWEILFDIHTQTGRAKRKANSVMIFGNPLESISRSKYLVHGPELALAPASFKC